MKVSSSAILSLFTAITVALIAGMFSSHSSLFSQQKHIDELMLTAAAENDLGRREQILLIAKSSLGDENQACMLYGLFCWDSWKDWNKRTQKALADQMLLLVTDSAKINAPCKEESNGVSPNNAKVKRQIDITKGALQELLSRGNKPSASLSSEKDNFSFTVFKPFSKDRPASDYSQEIQKEIKKICLRERKNNDSKWVVWASSNIFSGTKLVTCNLG